MKRLRVLISAHEFSPAQGSECAVGWNISTRLANFHTVTVLCADGAPLWHNSYRDAVIRNFLQHGKIAGLEVVFVPQPPIAIRCAYINRKFMGITRGIGWQLLYYLGLDAWHRAAFLKVAELGLDNFDLMHQLTPISFLRPGYLWTFEKPFFWGPLGGMFKVPSAFANLGGFNSLIFESVRSFNIERQVRSDSFRKIVQKAKRIWTITNDERCIVNAMSEGKAVPMIDTAPPKETVGRVRHYDGTVPLRLCWSGRHEPRKALPLLLYALAALPERQKVFLDVLGQGPETQKWKEMANKLGLTNINWHGRLPYHEALKTMGKSDAFVHTSYREAASMVVLEALGWGMPVICHDACGMAVAVNSTCGIKVPFVNPESSINGFRKALEQLLHNPQKVEQLSKGALRRASELSWDAKVKEILEGYSSLVAS
ncbi:putative Glycosyl transferase group 1 [uncultured Desulfobacterium sp.]|uniref:Putative Glycosyl transferase group 1 n=1 Tax=uncultured Desulfobacterium sp. TaxID=201089 RepID=A0A445MUI7_9BACT|nr:putative Glycosyl transferase group 1 [uncultured Desulfobacterium sp.]